MQGRDIKELLFFYIKLLKPIKAMLELRLTIHLREKEA